MMIATSVPTGDPMDAKPGSNDSISATPSEKELYAIVTTFVATRNARNHGAPLFKVRTAAKRSTNPIAR
jgi:hypothetical protein